MPQPDEITDEQRRNSLLAANGLLTACSEAFIRATNNATKVAELTLQLNEQSMSLCEKWILLDGGTIALSLALIGSLLSRVGRVPRHPFEWLVCPAWFLLLLSMFCWWHRVATIHRVNVALFHSMAADIKQNNLQGLAVSMTRLKAELGSAIVQPTVNQNLAKAAQQVVEACANLSDNIAKYEEMSGAARQQATEVAVRAEPLGLVGVASTILALILLCGFAIIAILSL